MEMNLENTLNSVSSISSIVDEKSSILSKSFMFSRVSNLRNLNEIESNVEDYFTKSYFKTTKEEIGIIDFKLLLKYLHGHFSYLFMDIINASLEKAEGKNKKGWNPGRINLELLFLDQ
mmetsp:Transcript_29701/g.26283  ORF Transcript_29701/g.26283 Transcript_29701/m.26283 type:complete len:118 (-) Transcript_29701:780-1133(-)